MSYPLFPTFICSIVNSLGIKLKHWLWCLSKLLSFALIHFHSHHEREDKAASSTVLLSDTSWYRYRIPRHIVSCEPCHCFSKTWQHYCTKRDDCRGILWTVHWGWERPVFIPESSRIHPLDLTNVITVEKQFTSKFSLFIKGRFYK